jgi:hypothetical protein
MWQASDLSGQNIYTYKRLINSEKHFKQNGYLSGSQKINWNSGESPKSSLVCQGNDLVHNIIPHAELSPRLFIGFLHHISV